MGNFSYIKIYVYIQLYIYISYMSVNMLSLFMHSKKTIRVRSWNYV